MESLGNDGPEGTTNELDSHAGTEARSLQVPLKMQVGKLLASVPYVSSTDVFSTDLQKSRFWDLHFGIFRRKYFLKNFTPSIFQFQFDELNHSVC